MRLLVPALLLSLLASGCGGSSSETPPPLEPDPTSLRYTGPRMPSVEATPAPEAPPDEDDVPAAPKKPAAGTWGSGKAPAPASAPAPALSSEAPGQR